MGNDVCLKEPETGGQTTPNNHPTLIRAKTSKKDAEIKMLKSTIIESHNNLRKKHNAPELTEDPKLSEIADEYANNLLNNESGKENIYKGKIFGENVFISENKDIKYVKEMFKKWEDEGNNYDYDKSKYTKDASHFTQIIWKETKQIGIGFSQDESNKKYYFVFLYYPPGNTLGEFSKNVSKE